MNFLYLIIVLLVFVCSPSRADNWKLVSYETQVSYQNCWPYQYEKCTTVFILFKRCERQTAIQCAVDYRTETRYKRICIDGWDNLPNCLTPICTSCQAGQICTAPEKCSCLSPGGVCTNVPCSESKSCYPGTCKASSCQCNQYFYGDDCQTIKRTPTSTKCEVTIQMANQKELTITCSPPNIDPEIKWINSINNIIIRYESYYESAGLNLPDSIAAPYARFPPSFGVSNASYSISLISANGSSEKKTSVACGSYSADSPATRASCDGIKSYGETGLPSLRHNDIVQVDFYSNLGGNVEGIKNPQIPFSSFPKKLFGGDKVIRSTKFQIDDQPPVHCLIDQNADCPTFPIYLENDITNENIIYPQFLGWSDSGSGIASYHVEVYLLRAATTKILENVGIPIFVRTLKSTENTAAITFSTPGVYSIELTVYDQVNNSASARNIIIYNDNKGIETNPEKPLQVKEAVKIEENKNEWWITDVSKLSSKSITVLWDGHCSSKGQFNDEWTFPVNPWNKGIDDIPHKINSYGIRTISKYDGLVGGIYSYSLSTYIGPKSSRLFNQTVEYNSTVNSAIINCIDAPLHDGTTVGVQFSCADMSGGRITEELFINVDTSSATAANITLQKNYPDIYTSSVNLWIEEKDSGIKSINYKIFLGSNNNNNPLISQSIAPKTRDAPNANKGRKKREALEGPCTVDDKSCYCTPLGLCYDYYQSVGIDHCLIDRVNNNDFYFDVTVTNLAGLTSTAHGIKLRDMKDLECRPASKLTPGQIAAIVICVLILLAILCVILFLLIRIYHFKKSAPRVLTQIYSSAVHRIRGRKVDHVSTPNDLYIPSEELDERHEGGIYNNDGYIYSGEYTRLKKLPENSITLKEELSKGKITMVNIAILNDNGRKETVAVKYLKNGSSSKSKKMFEEKINFHGDLTVHENIVKFLGICEKPQGPMMVMEYCELPLKTWLSGLGEMTPDILDDMCTISLNVASGVEHLHKRKIIHKRLLAKNVLLTKQFSQYVAKLIGFSPEKHRDDTDTKASVPIKWLAPETLDTITNSQPIYNEKTDAWTYGILLWEIYTKALTQPYPELNSSEAKKVIILGNAMSMPENCPESIYERVMSKCWSKDPQERPDFAKISSEIEAYRGIVLDATGYYIPQ